MKKIPMLERFAAQSLVESDGELIFSKEKFAELVAEECMNIIVQNRKYASEHKWPAVELANVCLYEIDKTFGVHEDGKETVSG
jgi:hypothetical protein